ncbi:hypothetical protein LZ554_004391 [Drepanopeziza brunnea f. sp. 'monogermtubi']|nr:hypothetical protein LZ554_004391 [Drepanopeziza brunnea f. sp. 'monogermtubi']
MIRFYAGHPFRVATAALKTVFLAHVYYEYGIYPAPTKGASMVPTFSVIDDHVLIDRSYRRGRNLQVGDVISFDSVVGPGERVIKRVVGLAGDYVVRGTPSPLGNNIDEATGSMAMIQVPQGHCWVVGDNLPYSRDSRHFGPLPMALIKGKVIAKVWPWEERSWIVNGMEPVESESTST